MTKIHTQPVHTPTSHESCVVSAPSTWASNISSTCSRLFSKPLSASRIASLPCRVPRAVRGCTLPYAKQSAICASHTNVRVRGRRSYGEPRAPALLTYSPLPFAPPAEHQMDFIPARLPRPRAKRARDASTRPPSPCRHPRLTPSMLRHHPALGELSISTLQGATDGLACARQSNHRRIALARPLLACQLLAHRMSARRLGR